MARNIRDYKEKMGECKSTCDKSERVNVEKKVNSDYDRYNAMTENQLMNELEREVFRLKSQGVLTPQMLESFYSQMSGSMTDEQRNRLRVLINIIK